MADPSVPKLASGSWTGVGFSGMKSSTSSLDESSVPALELALVEASLLVSDGGTVAAVDVVVVEACAVSDVVELVVVVVFEAVVFIKLTDTEKCLDDGTANNRRLELLFACRAMSRKALF